jgi:hypothetical protein
MVQYKPGAFGHAEQRILCHIRLHTKEALEEFRKMMELDRATA